MQLELQWKLVASVSMPPIVIDTRPYPVTLVNWPTTMRVNSLATNSGSGTLAYAGWGGESLATRKRAIEEYYPHFDIPAYRKPDHGHPDTAACFYRVKLRRRNKNIYLGGSVAPGRRRRKNGR